MKIKTVNTILYCQRWKETVAFYQSQLKLPVTMANEWFIEFELNETSRLSVANEARASIKSYGGKGITITMEVDDIYATQSFLNEAGIDPATIKEHAWGSKVIHIYDPEGSRLEFWCQNKKID